MQVFPTLLLSAAGCFSAGCLVRSVHAWLPDEAFVRARLAEPGFFAAEPLYSLEKRPAAGTWKKYHILILTYIIYDICSEA